MKDIKQPVKTPRKGSKKLVSGLAENAIVQPRQENESEGGLQSESSESALVGEFIGKEDESVIADPQALASLMTKPGLDEDEAVVQRVEHLNRSVGWLLVSAGVVGMVVPGVLGTPFLIMGGLVLWPGNHKKVERWRQGHSPKVFHGAMKQINRFLDDLEKRYPSIDKQ